MESNLPTLRGVHEDALTDRLDQLDAKPHRSGDSIRSKGFCHSGDDPDTLSFRPTEDGRSWEPHCFKGCDSVEIVQKIQAGRRLPVIDGPVASWTVSRTDKRDRPAFFDAAEQKRVLAEHQALIARPDLVAYLEAERRITPDVITSEFIGWRASEKRFPIPYGSPFPEDRKRVYQRDRWQPPEHRTDAPKLLAETGRSRWLFYPAPWLLEKRWAVLTEGAMDALAVVSAGLPAIAAPSGMEWNGSWTSELRRLKLSKIFLPFDADENGQKFVAKVTAKLEGSGITVYAVELPGLAEHGDVTDFLKGFASIPQGGKALRQLCEDAEPKPDGLEFTWASDVHMDPLNPLLPAKWGYRFPEAVLTLLGGREDIGKTTLACQLVADVTNGELGTPGRFVIVFTSEDSASAISKRLKAAGADMTKVAIVSRVWRNGKPDGFRIPRDASDLEKLVRQIRPALIVIGGSLMAHIESARTDSRSTVSMREALEPIHSIAERHQIAALSVVHPNKSRHSDVAMAISESAAIIQSARSAVWLDWEDDDKTTLVLAHFKHNESAEEKSLTFKRAVVDLGNGVTAPRLERIGTSELTANELQARRIQSTSGEGKISKRDLAAAQLKVLLADHQPHPIEPVRAVLEAARIGKGTIDRARTDLGIQTTHSKTVPPEHFWTLPEPFKREDEQDESAKQEPPDDEADSSLPTDPPDHGDGETGETGENGSGEPNQALATLRSPQLSGAGETGPKSRPNPFLNGRRFPPDHNPKEGPDGCP